VEVDVQIERVAEALDECDGAALDRDEAARPGPLAQETEDAAQEAAEAEPTRDEGGNRSFARLRGGEEGLEFGADQRVQDGVLRTARSMTVGMACGGLVRRMARLDLGIAIATHVALRLRDACRSAREADAVSTSDGARRCSS
jgi:hypothetical protein